MKRASILVTVLLLIGNVVHAELVGMTGAAASSLVNVNNVGVGSGSIATSQASSIGSSSTSIVSARTGAIGTGRIAVTLVNYGAVTVWIGNSGVTTSTGFPLTAGASVTIPTTVAVYGVVASGTGTVAVLETY